MRKKSTRTHTSTATMIGVLALGSAAAAQHHLSLHSPDPGIVGHVNTIEVTGAEPHAQVAFVAGFHSGRLPIPHCNVTLGIADPHLIGIATADGHGQAHLSRFVPVSLGGEQTLLQAVSENCRLSEVVMVTWHQ